MEHVTVDMTIRHDLGDGGVLIEIPETRIVRVLEESKDADGNIRKLMLVETFTPAYTPIKTRDLTLSEMKAYEELDRRSERWTRAKVVPWQQRSSLMMKEGGLGWQTQVYDDNRWLNFPQ